MPTVEQLYKDFGVLADAKDKAGAHEKEYRSILSAVKGTPNEKRLASQFIARFFRYFPTLAEPSLDAQFDLCEDEDVNIRKQAIKDIPTLCKGAPEHVPRITDVLTQILQTDDAAELGLVQTSLVALLRLNMKGGLEGIFSQIQQGEDLVRERAIKFLHNKVRTLPEELWTKEVEDFMLHESKKVLQDVTGGEFVMFMAVLSGLQSMSTMQGRQQLVEIVTEQADLDQEFEASDPDAVDRLVQCARQALPYYSKNVHSNRFLVYICDQVLPVLDKIENPPEDATAAAAATDGEKPTPTNVDLQLDMLKVFAELSMFCGPMDKAEQRVENVFNKLIEYMPLPPSEGNDENADASAAPKLQFSYVECLMAGFHQMAAKCPQFLTAEDSADRLKDFRIRLQYFARGVQLYIKQLRMTLQGKTPEQLQTDENRIKVVALKTTNNINTLIKDLFHNPPSYKATVNLSWKPVTSKPSSQQETASPGQKRPGITPITYEGGKKAAKSDQKMYTPPSGKYSNKAGTYTAPSGGRGRGRGRGGRGRGFRRW